MMHVLHGATRTMLVHVDAFTSTPMAKARLDAHPCGMQVQVILDTRQRTERYASADFLVNQGVPTMIDTEYAIWYLKVMHDRRRARHHRELQLHQGGAGDERGARVDQPQPRP
jgi:hypothetical protein